MKKNKNNESIQLDPGVTFVPASPTRAAHFRRPRGRPFKGYTKATFRIPPWVVEELAKASTKTALNKSECVTEALRLWLNV